MGETQSSAQHRIKNTEGQIERWQAKNHAPTLDLCMTLNMSNVNQKPYQR
jgi:hypothetical protein